MWHAVIQCSTLGMQISAQFYDDAKQCCYTQFLAASIPWFSWLCRAAWGASVSAKDMVKICVAGGNNSRIIGRKRPLRSSSPTVNPTPPCLLNRILKCHIYVVFEHLQGWRLHHLAGQPVPTPDHSFSKEVFPNIQSEPPLMQLEVIASRPVSGYLGEETNPRLTAATSHFSPKMKENYNNDIIFSS